MTPTLSRIFRGLGAALALLAVLVYVGYLIVYIVYAVDLFHWPFDYDQGEGFELYDAILYSQGEWPYRDNAAYPFYASNYPPLFHLLIVPLFPVFGQGVIAGRIVCHCAAQGRRLAHPSHVRAGLLCLQLRLSDRATVPDAFDDGDV